MKVKLGGDFNEVPDSKPLPKEYKLVVLKLDAVDQRESNNTGEPMVECRWSPVKDAEGKTLKEKNKKAVYDPIFSYAPLDPESNWARRMKELLRALGLKLDGTVDIKPGKEVLAKIREGENQDGDYRPEISKLMKLGTAVADEDEEEEADGEEEESEEEVDLSELDRTQLKKFIKENELDIKVTRGMTDDAVREAIAAVVGDDEEEEGDEEEVEEEEEAEEEEEEAEEDEEEDEVDLSTLNRTELKALIKDQELEIKVTKGMSDDDVRNAIVEALSSGDEEEEEEAEEEEEEESDGPNDNYDDLDADTLRQECKDRELQSSGNKKQLIARLRKDDAESPV